MGRHGENIHKRKDGRWEARLMVGHGATGKAIYRYFYGKSYLEAKRKRNASAEGLHLLSASKEKAISSKLTVGALAESWLRSKCGIVKESTYAHYTSLLEKQILPELGAVRLSMVTSERLERFLQDKLRQGRADKSGGLSRKTAADLRAVLNQILKYGTQQGFAHLSAVVIPPITVQAPKIQTIHMYEQKALEVFLLRNLCPLHLGILTVLYTGLRIGEVCALQWKNVLLDTGTIQVQKTIIRIRDLSDEPSAKTKVLIEPPKTQCSIRTIPLPDFLTSLLAANRMEAEAYLLTGTRRFLEPRVCLYQYKETLKKAGIPDYSFHALRHTFATRCVEAGFDVKSLSEIMGHSNVSITMQRYVHPSLERKREQMNKLTPLSIHSQKNRQEIRRNA